MVVGLPELLRAARAQGRAVGAFACHGLTQAQGVLDAAEDHGAPVVLLVPPEAFAARRGEALVRALAGAAALAGVPACVQVDHVRDVAVAWAALEAGAHAVMVDGSRLRLAGNAALVSAVVRAARPRGAAVEAEVGGLAGSEDGVREDAELLTDPADAFALVSATGVDCLAVAIGTVHGDRTAYRGLDLDRLAAVRVALGDLPLALHGGSGVPEADLRAAVAGGIAKVNVNAELRRAHLAATSAGVAEAGPAGRLTPLVERTRDAAAGVAAAALERLAPRPAKV